jgi:hypothetical protein
MCKVWYMQIYTPIYTLFDYAQGLKLYGLLSLFTRWMGISYKKGGRLGVTSKESDSTSYIWQRETPGGWVV